MIAAKFVCETVTLSPGQETVALRPVYGDSEENKTWSKYTPCGTLQMTITNPDVFGQIRPGDEFVVYLNKVVKEPTK